MSKFTKAGYTDETIFKVINPEDEFYGKLVRIYRDDRSNSPLFKDIDGVDTRYLIIPSCEEPDLEVYIPSSTDAPTTSDEGEYIGSPTPQNVTSVTVGASVEIKILLDVQGFRFGLNRDEAYTLYKDLQKVFEESII